MLNIYYSITSHIPAHPRLIGYFSYKKGTELFSPSLISRTQRVHITFATANISRQLRCPYHASQRHLTFATANISRQLCCPYHAPQRHLTFATANNHDSSAVHITPHRGISRRPRRHTSSLRSSSLRRFLHSLVAGYVKIDSGLYGLAQCLAHRLGHRA